MVKPLAFKGDKKVKKRRRDGTHMASKFGSSVLATASVDDIVKPDEPDPNSWVSPSGPSDLSGLSILVFAHAPISSRLSTGPSDLHTPRDRRKQPNPTGDSDRETDEEEEEDDQPVMTVAQPLPDLSLLCSDSANTVFGLALVNAIGGHAQSAEPDDPRQVWTVMPVVAMGVGASSTSSTAIALRHGLTKRYLESDRHGNLFADREAIGMESSWQAVPVRESDQINSRPGDRQPTMKIDPQSGAVFALQNKFGRFLGLRLNSTSGKLEVRADLEPGESNKPPPESWCVIRIQAKAKTAASAAAAAARSGGTRVAEYTTKRELEALAKRSLTDEEARQLRRARKDGRFHDELLRVKIRGKSDKFA